MLAVMGTAPLQIGQVAQKTGLSVDAIRFYEKSGLLPRPARTQGGYRLYEEREVAESRIHPEGATARVFAQ
jgi:DNA-binding transcriptional MerR regulator